LIFVGFGKPPEELSRRFRIRSLVEDDASGDVVPDRDVVRREWIG